MSERKIPKSPWKRINPKALADPIGYSHAIVSRGGRRIHLSGQVAMDAEGVVGFLGDLVSQARVSMDNLAQVLKKAGGRPEHLVRLRIYVMDADEYARNAREIGMLYRQYFGKWFPAMTLVQVARLYDPGALIEIEGEAVVPDAEAI